MADGEIIMTAAAKKALLVRLDPEVAEGGDFSTPSQKSTEMADILHDMIEAVVPTGA